MTKITTSFDKLFDEAIEQLPFLRRQIAKRHFRKHPADRDECCERALLACSQSPVLGAFGADYQQGNLTVSSVIELDPDTAKRWLDLIIEYLPKILEIVLKLLPLFMSIMVFIAIACGASDALAQDCPNGICPTTTQTVARQWFNRDGLTTRQHAEQYHNTDTSGMSESQIIAQNDHDHNSWGSGNHYPSERSSVQAQGLVRRADSGHSHISSSVGWNNDVVLDLGYVVSSEVPAGRQVSYVDASGIIRSEPQAFRAVVYASHSEAVWMASGGADEHRYPLRSFVRLVGNRSRMAIETIRGSRPVASLFGATRQAARNTLSAVRPRNIRAAIRAQACR